MTNKLQETLKEQRTRLFLTIRVFQKKKKKTTPLHLVSYDTALDMQLQNLLI